MKHNGKGKRWMSLLLAAVMAFGLAACGNASNSGSNTSESAETQESGGEAVSVSDKNTLLNVGYNTTVTTLDPFNNENAYPILDMLYMMLFTRDGFGGALQYGLANGYEQVDAYTYVISIRDNVVDSLGNPTTAEDVAWAYNYCKDNGNISKASYIESCEVTGENEITLVLNSDALEVFEDVTTAVWVVSQASYEACGNSMVLGGAGATGYEVVSFTPGAELTITRTDDWWAEDCEDLADQYARNVGTITVQFITEASQLQTGLETGTLQLAFQVNSLYSADFVDLPGFEVYGIISNSPMQLLYNCTEDSICSDPLIRQAVAYCINRETMVNSVTYGMGAALKSLGSDLFAGYQEKWDSEDYYDYDIEKAKELLEEAGYNGEEIRLMVVANNNNQGTVASILQASCIEAGMNVTIDTYETATFMGYRNASQNMYDMFIYTEASSGYMASLFRYYLDAEQYGGASINGIKDAALQELITTVCEVETMTDENIDAVHQYVKENCYQLGLIAISRDCVYVDEIESVYLSGHAQIAPNAVVLKDSWDLFAD